MRTRRNMVTGIAAAALALTACGIAAGTAGGTPGTHAAAPQAGHAETDTRVTDMRELAQVKRHIVWTAGSSPGRGSRRRTRHGSPTSGTLPRSSGTSWHAGQQARGR